MSDELKPCPFCGRQPERFVCVKTLEHDYAVIYECKDAHHRVWCEADNDVDAIDAWNTRAERTCRWVPFDEGHSIAGPGWRCSECGLELGPENVFVVERCYCCPSCCSKAVG